MEIKLTQEQIDGLREYKEAKDAILNRINEKHNELSPARKKAVEYVKERKRRMDEIKKWKNNL